MARTYQVISADGHVEVPPTAWTQYVPEKYRERAPRVISLPEGGHGILAEGKPLSHPGRTISHGPALKLKHASYVNTDGTPVPGTGGPEQRLREQDGDGIDAEVLFPPASIGGIDGVADRQAYVSMVQAYNTFLAEYCSHAPDRLIGCGILPKTGIDDAISEVRRCRDLGLRCVSPSQFPNGTPYWKPEDDKFWAATLELGMRVAPHIALGAWQPPPLDSVTGKPSEFAIPLCGRVDSRCPFGMAQLIVAGVLDRFAELRIYFAEVFATWFPIASYLMDDNYAIYKDMFGVTLNMLPSEYLRRYFYFGIIREPLAVRMRDFLPADRLMWGSDFPHGVCTYPRSRQELDEHFAEAPLSLRRRILLENPAEFFGLDLEKPITPTGKGLGVRD